MWSGLGLWLLSLLLTASYLAEPFLGFAGCELVPGTSLYGEPGRSWFPPGQTCSYALPGTLEAGQPLVLGPPTLRLLVVGIALAGLPVCVRLRRLLLLARRPAEERVAA